MTPERDTLGKVQAISNIVAAVVIPVLIAYFGWVSERNAAESHNSSEFVKMALNILADNSESVSSDLKQWAIRIIDKESPAPLSKGLSSAIVDGSVPIDHYIPAPKEVMTPPIPVPEFTGRTNGDLLQYVLDLKYAYKLNMVNHETLLEWLQRIEGSSK